ncbi:MAG: condensation domain-containing protein, partial [Actinomycetota bacterium]
MKGKKKSMVPRAIEGFQTSPQQTRIWKLHEEGGPCFSSCRILIEGRLDKELLKKALSLAVRQNSVLRTSFHHVPGLDAPLQVISDSESLQWNEVITPDPGELSQQDPCPDFDLLAGPPLKASLFGGTGTYILVLTGSAMCVDTVTLDLLFKQICESYAALVTGGPAADLEPVQYLQVSEWFNELIEGKQKVYADWPKSPNLTLAGQLHPVEPVRFAHKMHSIRIPRRLLQRIESLLNGFSVAPRVWWAAVLQVLLARLSGEEQVQIAYVHDGRVYEELQNVLGPCSYCVPVCADLNEDCSFLDVLQSTAKQFADVDSENAPFFRMPAVSTPNDLTLCALELQTSPANRVSAGVTFSMQSKASHTEGFALKAVVAGSDDQTGFQLHYNPSFFTAEAIAQMSRCLVALMESAAA